MENRMDDEEDVVFVRKNVSVLGEMGNRMGDENGVVFAKKAPNAQGMGNRRRALRDIKNFVDAPQMTKRVPQSKCSLDDKNATFVARRPITRKYAESLASKSQAHRQNARQKKQLIPGTCCPDDDKQISGSPLPMNVDHELKEVEMDDLPMDNLPDIDSCDSNDPLAAVEYVEDIYKFYRSSEVSSCVSPDYMSNQFDINDKMRSILVDWLIEVHYKFELMDETLYLTINTIDRFLEKQSIVRKKLQLVGVTAMLLACKYEEVSVPIIEDLVVITDRAYAREEIIEMEKQMANTLKFYMSVPTPYVFMKRFLKAAQASKRIELLSFFIMELSMVQYLMLKYRPSLLSAAAVYTAQCTIKGFRHWTRTCELHTTYAEHQLLECSRLMVALHQKASTGKLTVVHKKYSTSKFGCVALLVPALFLLN